MAGHVGIEPWRRKLFEYHFFWQILYSQPTLFVFRNIFHPSWRQFQSTIKSQFKNDRIVFSKLLSLSEHPITIFYFLIIVLARSLLLKKRLFGFLDSIPFILMLISDLSYWTAFELLRDE